MTSQTLNSADGLAALVADGRIAAASIQSVPGMTEEALAGFLGYASTGEPGLLSTPAAQTPDERARLIAVGNATPGRR